MDPFVISPQAISYRVRMHAEWLGYSLSRYYRTAGLNYQAMKSAISGMRSTVTRGDAVKIRETYGITLDYIYGGYRDGLPLDFQRFLDSKGHHNDLKIAPPPDGEE